jgi:hypothetical protein
VERWRAKGKWINVVLSGRDKDEQGKRERIKESRYNRENEGCMTEEILKYLGREKNDGEIQMFERRERKQVLEGRRGKKMQNVP